MQSVVTFIMFCTFATLSAQDIVLPESIASQATTYRSFIQPESNLPQLTTNTRIAAIVSNYDTQIGAEVFMHFAKPANFDPVHSINSIVSLSKLTGLEYYSASRKRFRALILDAYHNKAQQPDTRSAPPVFATIPDAYSSNIVLNTATFGKNEFIVDFNHQEGHIALELLNQKRIRMNSFPYLKIADAKQFVSLFVIQVHEQTISVYAYSGVHNKLLKPSNKIAPKKKIAQSLTNRIIALTSWVYTQLNK